MDISKDGLLCDSNSIPTCKIPIEKVSSINDKYEVELKPFARGKFATVKHCTDKLTRTSYAAKYIKKRRRCQDVSHEILHEARVLIIASSNERIVQLHEIFEDKSEYILILELASGGELQQVLDEDEFLPESTSKHVMRQVLEAVEFLHDNQIAHLDIKPQNILLTAPLPYGNIKLCDFGISRLISNGSDLREIIGTPDYVAPEILNYERISLATDMWSLGCLTYVLLSGMSPFGGDDKQETFCNITTANLDFPIQYFADTSDDAIDFIGKLIVKEPKKRLSCVQAINHTWLTTPGNHTAKSTMADSTTVTPTTSSTPSSPSPTPHEEDDDSFSSHHHHSHHHHSIHHDVDHLSQSKVWISPANQLQLHH